MFIDEDGEVTEVDCTRAQLEAALREAGLIGDSDTQYATLNEFLDSNGIRVYKTELPPIKMSLGELVSNWV